MNFSSRLMLVHECSDRHSPLVDYEGPRLLHFTFPSIGALSALEALSIICLIAYVNRYFVISTTQHRSKADLQPLQ
ncbi:hypothetical protein L484_019914 [Morus notabilis]|uniref:Uncharacterized protein n=1 Tax=Morus notabilis TaxID=981085 RepID=W9R2T3_9ROSA|nr:hypothetical protein L484_019914 [Morus notabilis]